MRKHGKKFVVVFTVIVALGLASQAVALELGVRGYTWFPSLSADARSQGTTTSLSDTLGVGNKPVFSGEIYGGVGKHHASFMYTPFGYSDNKVLASDVTFNGVTYNAGSGVKTDLKFDMYDFKYQYDIVNLENVLAGFSFGPVLQVKYVSGEMKLDGAGLGAGFNQKRSFSAPVPMVGLGAHAGLIANLLEARAQITGMGYSGNFIMEGTADLSLTPFPFVDIHAGYKIMKMRIDTNDFYMDSTFSGPFAALTVGF